MSPADVPADLIEKMLSTRLPVSETEARVLLAAVLPEIQAQALRDAAGYRGPADETAYFTPEARMLLRRLADRPALDEREGGEHAR